MCRDWLLTGKLISRRNVEEERDGGDVPSGTLGAGHALAQVRAAHPGSTLGPRHGVPGEGPRAPSGQRGGGEHSSRGCFPSTSLNRGAGGGLVDGSRAS